MNRMLANLGAVALVAAAVAVPSLLPARAGLRDDPDHEWADDTTFAVTQVRPGVYFAVGSGSSIVGANSTFIVTDRDVILVDDHITPRAARALMVRVRQITDKPLRYVVNTHFHYDHTSGNTIFGPDVEILSSPYTRDRLIATGQASITQVLQGTQATIATLRARRDTARTDSLRRALDAAIARNLQLADDYTGLTVALPTLTIDSSIVIHRGGGQELRIFFLGKGHTAGDIVVQMPKESLLIAGDLITNTAGLPNMMDGYAGDWGATLRRLAQLPFATTIPGHGLPFDGKARYLQVADAMDTIWRQARALAPSVPADEPAERVAARFDVARLVGNFPGLRSGLPAAGAKRAVDLAAGRDH